MDNYETISEMKEFTKDNIIFYSILENGEITQEIKNGKKRIVNALSNKVEVLDKNGNILYSKILDETHPLICLLN